jgi:hypothetical protein
LQIYATYLMGMVKYSPAAKTSELKELESLKAALALENLHVGEAHCLAATEWYRTTCLFTPEEELDDVDHPDRQAMDKLLFLTERALRQGGETDEAFRFEMTRVAKAVKLDLSTALDRVAETAEPFYARALKSTRAKLGTNQVSSAMLERARSTLGIADETAFDMHVAAFNDEVRELLGLAAATGSGTSAATESDTDSSSPTYLGAVKFPDGAIERVRCADLVVEWIWCDDGLIGAHALASTAEYFKGRFGTIRHGCAVRNCIGGYPTLSIDRFGGNEGCAGQNQNAR